MKCTSFAHLQALFGRPRIVSYALGSGPRRGPACTPWRKRGSRPGSVARALGVQSCAICQVITWSFSAELEPARPMETPKRPFFPFIFSPLYAAVSEGPQQPSRARKPQYSSRASSFSLCDSHERCFCACVFVSVRVLSCVSL